MPASTFADKFSSDAPLRRKKASILRAVILVVIAVLPLAAASDFLTKDFVNASIEMAVLVVFLFALALLYRGRYSAASLTVVVATCAMMLAMSMVVAEPSGLYLYRNAIYYAIAFTLALLFSEVRRLPPVIAYVGGVLLAVFSAVRLLPAGLTLVDVVSQLLVAEILFAVICFFTFKSADLSAKLNQELEAERAASAERLVRLSAVVQGAGANLQSMGQLTSRVEEIRTLLSGTSASIRAMEDRISELATASDGTASAASRIGDRIGELKNSIEEESSAQIQSSASINEMVASIGSVADSATRRRAAMEGLAGTDDDGMSRLDSLLSYIAKIEGSIGSIQSMVGVINAIAGSTNLLSMNAAIEAAHAGDAGRGFAVVAEEIRKLADTSGKNAKEIGRQLKEVIAVITAAAEESGRTRESFESIRREIDGAMDAFREITSATGELAEGGRQILEALKTLTEMSSRVKNGGEEIEIAQSTLEELHLTSVGALSALRNDASAIREKEAEVLRAADAVARIGDQGVKDAEELHRRSSSLDN